MHRLILELNVHAVKWLRRGEAPAGEMIKFLTEFHVIFNYCRAKIVQIMTKVLNFVALRKIVGGADKRALGKSEKNNFSIADYHKVYNYLNVINALQIKK